MKLLKHKTPLIFGTGILVVIGLFFINTVTPGNQDAFAQCIKDSGAKFYGAFWCSHCQAQKQAFGKSEKLLPYIECSTSDAKGQTDVCKDAGVTSYPTWVFTDGSRLSGEQSHETLAEKTKCTAPTE